MKSGFDVNQKLCDVKPEKDGFMSMMGGKMGGMGGKDGSCKPRYQLWDQRWEDADTPNLEYNFAGVQMCATAQKSYKPYPYIGLRMRACNSKAEIFKAFGNRLINVNKYGKKKCLTATANTEGMAWGHVVSIDD